MYPGLKTSNLNAIAYHLEQGNDNGGISREALAKFLRSTTEMINVQDADNAALRAQLATLRALWTSLPAGTREGLREYHLATYRQWCAALGVSE